MIKNIIKLFSGTMFSQAIVFITLPLITRMFGADLIGVMNVFVSLTMILAILMPLSLNQSIPLADDDKEVYALTSLVFAFSSLLCVSLTIFLFFYGEMLSKVLNVQALGWVIYLLPFASFVFGLNLTLESICYRLNLFGLQAKAHIIQTLINQAIKIIAGVIYVSSFTLILGGIVGYLSKSFFLIRTVHVIFKNFGIRSLNVEYLKSTFIKYSEFPKFVLPQSLINSMSQHIPVFVLASTNGAETAGYFGIAVAVLGVPISMIGQSVSNVMYPRLAEKLKAGKPIYEDLYKATRWMLIIISVPTIIGYAISPWLFEIVFGEQWRTAGDYASFLIFSSSCMLLSRPSIAIIPILDLNRTFLKFEVCAAIIRTISLVGSIGITMDPLKSILIYSITTSVAYVMLTSYVILSAKAHISNCNQSRVE